MCLGCSLMKLGLDSYSFFFFNLEATKIRKSQEANTQQQNQFTSFVSTTFFMSHSIRYGQYTWTFTTN